VGFFESVDEMERVYDAHKGTRSIRVDETGFELLDEVPQTPRTTR